MLAGREREPLPAIYESSVSRQDACPRSREHKERRRYRTHDAYSAALNDGQNLSGRVP